MHGETIKNWLISVCNVHCEINGKVNNIWNSEPNSLLQKCRHIETLSCLVFVVVEWLMIEI